MKKFKPLEWEENRFLYNGESANISVNHSIIYSQACISMNISNKWCVTFLGNEDLFNINHTELSTKELAKELAENCYQEAMNKLYNDIEKMIDN